MPINDSIPGQLHREEMRAIELLAQLVPENGHIVEVGSLLGLSSWIWAKSVHDSVTVHCIDPWELAGSGGNFKLLAENYGQTFSKEQFLANVSDCPNIRAHQGFSPDAFANWTQPIDLYFEDAVHVDPILARNLEFWSSHLKASGILCGHDYTERFPNVRAGVVRLAERYNRHLLIINSLWLLLPNEFQESTEENTSRIVRQLQDLADHYPPLGQQVAAQRNQALAVAGEIQSFDYEIAIEDDPMEIESRLGDEIILNGSVRNVSGYDLPSALSRDCFLQIGAELHISGRLAAAARQKIIGDCFADGQIIRFELRLSASHVGIGNCVIDLLYRQLFWFGNRGMNAKSIPTRIVSVGTESHVAEIRAMRPLDLYRNHKTGITQGEFRARCGGSPIWHSVDLGDLFIEGVRKNSGILASEMRCADLPDLRGKSVLDIGAFTGWFSFESERRGAVEVVALDYHSWRIDWSKLGAYIASEREAGRICDPYNPPPHLIDEVGQPGRSVFDLTKQLLDSKVEPVLSRVEDYDPGRQFDIVLYLGVLYHCQDPFGALRKVASLTKERLIIETLGIHYPGAEDRAIWKFIGDDSENQDITTWWCPNEKGLIDMLKAAGFRHAEIKCDSNHLSEETKLRPQNIRIWGHA